MTKWIGIVILLIQTLSYSCRAQLYDKVWVVGDQASIFKFDSNLVKHDTLAYQITSRSSWSSICDELGNLQFFTNGVGVFTKASRSNSDGIYNSQGITDPIYESTFTNGTPSAHANLIFPRGNLKYYLVCQSVSDSQLALGYIPDNLYYAEVDMNANAGLGAVTSKRNLLYHGGMTKELFTACRHGNGRDYWLVVNGNLDSTYIKFLVTPDTILGPYIQSIGGIYDYPIVGQLSFSPDGSRMAGVTGTSKLNIFDFDRCSGTLSNPIILDIPLDTIYSDSANTLYYSEQGLGGISVSFSPSGRYLYYSNKLEVFQYDLQNIDIAHSRKLIYSWKLSDAGGQLGDGSFAPNGQIIIATWGGGSNVRGMGVIISPDLLDSSCHFVYDTTELYAYNPFILSNTFNYRLGKKISSDCDTVTGVEQIGVNTILTMLFPNPSKDVMQLDLHTRDLNEELFFVEYDLVGQEIFRKDIPFYQIQIYRNSLTSGIYTWQIENSKGQVKSIGKLVWE